MKKLFLLLCLMALTAVLSHSQVTQLSVDVPNPTDFYTKQNNTLWCWAACNQMLLNSQGIEETQENQVIKLFGRLVNQGAGPNFELSRTALAGTYDNSGDSKRVTAIVSYNTSEDVSIIINHLNQGIPVILGTAMHAILCVGVDYITNNLGSYQIVNIRYLDPAGSNRVRTVKLSSYIKNYIGCMTVDIR